MMYRNHEGYPDPTAGAALTELSGRSTDCAAPSCRWCTFARRIRAMEHNTQAAQRYSRFALENKRLPIAPHLFPQFMGAETDATRELALHMGMILLTRSAMSCGISATGSARA